MTPPITPTPPTPPTPTPPTPPIPFFKVSKAELLLLVNDFLASIIVSKIYEF